MTAGADGVRLRAVAPGEREAFLAMFAEYLRELDARAAPADPAPPLEAYRAAFGGDPGGQRLEWLLDGGERAGFLVTRVVPDWPDGSREIGEVIECYVAPARRRRGLGRAAVERWLARMRARGVAAAEASVLSGNAPARRFWERLGFEPRAVQTQRKP